MSSISLPFTVCTSMCEEKRNKGAREERGRDGGLGGREGGRKGGREEGSE